MNLFFVLLMALLLHLNDAFAPSYSHSSDGAARVVSSVLFADATDVSLDDCLLRGIKTMSKVMTAEFFESSPSLKTM